MTQAADYQPLVLVETADLSRDEWLAYRRKGLGGSDASAVLGISPFRTARDLYFDKLNIVTADDGGNWVAMEMGNLLEDLVARIFAKKTGLQIFQRTGPADPLGRAYQGQRRPAGQGRHEVPLAGIGG